MPDVPPGALKTIVDIELGDATAKTAAIVAARQQARAATSHAQNTEPVPAAAVPYGRLSERSPEWLGDFWRQCRALYAGGHRLLGDEGMLKSLFPKHAREADDVYKQRLERAFYLPYAGEIIDHLLAGFAQDPIRLTAGIDDAKGGEEKPLPAWWSEFAADVSPPDGQAQKLGPFAVDCLREMFISQSAWVLVDLPARDPSAPAPATRLEEERAGLLDPYLCLLPSENVVQWKCDRKTGELEWVLCHERELGRANLHASSMVYEEWTYWTRDGWERYALEWDPAHPPRRETAVPRVAEGEHALGVVPIVRLQVPDGLYAMGKLHSVAREHFNKRNAQAWAEYKALFAVLYEFVAPPTMGNFTPQGMAGDPNRAVNQTRGQGYTQVRGNQDSAQFIGPDVAPFKEARESCAELMREMHRVMFSMALSANMDSAALQRSGESKGQDAAQIAAILAKVGELLREGFDAVIKLVARVRGEEVTSRATGGEKFDADSIASAIEEATALLNGVPLKSPTFLQRYLYRVYKLALGPSATSADLQAIREELEDQVTAEAMLAADASPPGPLDKRAGDGAADEDEPEDDEEDDAPTKKPVSRRLISA